MENIWSAREIKNLTDKEKDLIIEKIFNTVLNYETHRDIGQEITEYLIEKRYIFQEDKYCYMEDYMGGFICHFKDRNKFPNSTLCMDGTMGEVEEYIGSKVSYDSISTPNNIK